MKHVMINKFAVVVPAYQAEATLKDCLDGLLSAGFAVEQITVVDDGSRDDTARIARDFGVCVIRNQTSLRPAQARNRGVASVTAEIVVMVDADVVLTSPAQEQFARHFADPSVTAVIGAYDDRPDGGSVVSDYRNLLHHHVHTRAAGPAQTFWTGIGAVRREAFLAAGGLQSEWENIEDVEFGLRLTEGGGRILLDPAIQGTHLKVWTPLSMFRVDLAGRAIPWARLVIGGRADAGRLNVSLEHRVSAIAVVLALASLMVAVLWPPALGFAVASLAVFMAASWPVLTTLSRVRGRGFAVRALPWHAVHYLAAVLGYAWVRLELATDRMRKG